MAPVRLLCPKFRCRQPLSTTPEMRGKVVTRQYCKTAFKVPAPKPASRSPDAPPSRDSNQAA